MEAGTTEEGPGSVAGRRERVLFDLAKRDKSDIPATFRSITEASAIVLDVARVGIWRLLPDGSALICEDGYLRDEDRHTRGEVLLRSDYPSYFRALSASRVIAAPDARTDARTRELAASYLGPRRITSMLDVPIWHQGRTFGVLCHEHVGLARHWSSDNEAFAGNLADIVAVSVWAGKHREMERRWEAVVNAIAEAVFVVDEQGQLALMNAMAANMAARAGGGLTFEERHRLVEFRDASGQVLSPLETPASRSLKGETLRGELIELLFRRTGERRSYRVSSAPLYEDGRVRSVVAVMADVTEEAYLESLKRDLLAALAHELKTPVAIVKGYAQHFTRNGEVPVHGAPMLGAIERAAGRLERLVDDLIEVSGITLGRLVLARERVELGALLQAVVEHQVASPADHWIRLTTPRPATVLADRTRLEQAIRRLVDNAIRFSPGGGEVGIELTVDEHSAVIAVRDGGIGIPEAQQRHVFEMFFRAHAGTPHDVGGLGIGLYLARQIAVRHGGEMWFESSEGRGSTFYMRLPREGAP
jgi:PAS domain S-box-containing protein